MRGELASYGHGLTDKPEIVVLSKADALTPEQIEVQIAKLKTAVRKTPLVLSSASRKGVPEALRALLEAINEARESGNEAHRKEAAWQP